MQKKLFRVFCFLLLLLPFFLTSHTEAAAKEIVNPKQTYTYKEMVRDIQKLQKAYPDLIKVKVIGKSEYGRDIYAVSLGKGSAHTFINGSHHAREWLTTNLNMYMLEQYAMSYQKKTKINGYDTRKILSDTTIWFVPMVNPDGVTLQQEGLSAFPKSVHNSLIKMNNGSKNFKRWKANAKGIDLNRQYDAGWKTIKNNAKGPSYKNYKGSKAASAAEVKAVIKFVNGIDPEMAVSYHSTGKILYWNFKQTTNYKRDLAYAKKIGSMTGYQLMYAGKNPSGGGFTDWFISSKKRPAFTPEISKYYSETNPPVSEFSGAWKENKAVGLYVAQESAKLYDGKMKKKKDELAKELKSIEKSANNLKKYYATNVKNESSLKTSKDFTNAYNKVKSAKGKIDSKVKALPSKYEKQLASYQKNIATQLKNSENYFAAIKAGDNVLKAEKALTDAFNKGQLNSKTVSTSSSLATAIKNSENANKKLYDNRVKNIAKKKYIDKPKATIRNTDYELQRYNLTLQLEKEVKEKKTDTAKTTLAKIEKLEADSKAVKKKDKYPTYGKIEKLLTDKKAKLKSEIEKQKAEVEKKKAEEAKKKAELEKQKAEEAKKKAELEKQKAEEEKQKAELEKQNSEMENQENVEKEVQENL